MARLHKRWLGLGLFALILASFASSCKPVCYDCIVTHPDTQLKDTLNSLCTDQPQYTATYLQSWKVFCESSQGETVKRED